MGGERLVRDRKFDINVYNTDQSKLNWNNFYLTTLPLETIFAPENYGPGKFQFEPITEYTGEYDGRHRLAAYYAMLDLAFSMLGQHLRTVGGVRYEKSDQKVTGLTADPTIPFSKARVDKGDLLPSANMTYVIDDRANLRLAYGRSVNRPEFREMADVKYYDFDEFQNVRGNPDLTRATIDSYDARFEFFPGTGEVLAVSYFYKAINDAIEIRLIPEPTRWVRTWFNSPNGVNKGWEMEARKSLGFLGDYFAGFTVTANYTCVESAIEYVDQKTAQDGSHIVRTLHRPMQGQAPWMVNLSLLFTEPTLGTDFSVLFNRIGRRMSSVGDSRYEDVYEEPRHSLDVSVTQNLKWFKAKLSAKDILAQDEVFTMGPPDFREPHSRIEQAPTYSLSLSLGL
jgi:TonB-dependent receptor